MMLHRVARFRTLLLATVLTASTAVMFANPVSAAAVAATVDDPAASATPTMTQTLLFRGGHVEGLNGITYHTFRIPAIARTNAGTLLAFAEGRAQSNLDYGNINTLYKRSVDNGATWSALKQAAGVGDGTFGNPTPVVDRATGTVWLFMSWNAANTSQFGGANPDTGAPTMSINQWGQRRVYVMKSTDDGQTFTGTDGATSPTDMTATLLPKTLANGAAWGWDAMGPGAGLYTADGTLVIPAQFRNIYSADHGATWHVQKIAETAGEATIIQLGDGSLYRNDRPREAAWNISARRWVSRGSITGGFSAYSADAKLLDPMNEASVLQYNNAETDAPQRTIFLNSASTETRTKMRVRISYDNAGTWPRSRPFSDAVLPAGAGTEGGYSSMAKTADFTVGALVETNSNVGDKASTRSIIFRKFNLSWILHGCEC